MKKRFFLASAFALALPIAALVPGCGGGNGTGSPFPTNTPFPTPTNTALATTTPMPPVTPLPTPVLEQRPVANLTVVTESSDGSSFGPSQFDGRVITVEPSRSTYTTTFGPGQKYSISFELPTDFSAVVGTKYQLSNSQATVLATLSPQGEDAGPQTQWGGTSYSQGFLEVEALVGNRFTLRLTNVVLSRRPAASGSNQGNSQLKLNGTISVNRTRFQ